jgi:hypothetical protein
MPTKASSYKQGSRSRAKTDAENKTWASTTKPVRDAGKKRSGPRKETSAGPRKTQSGSTIRAKSTKRSAQSTAR